MMVATPSSPYRQILELSQRMLAAGMAQRWDEMVELGKQRSALLGRQPDAADAVVSSDDKTLIAQIQACDTQLSEKLDAWLNHVRILLRMDQPPAA